MNWFSSVMSSLRPLPKAVVITIFTLLFSHVALYDLTSVSFFAPMEKAADFRFSDFYTLVADQRAEKKYEKDIVVVPLDGCDRREMAQAFSDIDFCAPAAIGLDVFFAPLRDAHDDPLAEVLSECDNLVLPVIAIEEDGKARIVHQSCYDAEVTPSGGFAAINILGVEGERANIREFRNWFGTPEDSVASLAAALVAIARPEAFKNLSERNYETEEISFASREFEVVYPDEILENQELIKDRIVLMGKLQDNADMHITPLHNFTPGLMIHAYITATILDGDYTNRLSEKENILLGAMLCFLVVWLNLHLMVTVMGPLLVRSLQVGLLYFMILTGTLTYIHWNVDLNFSYSILTVSLGVASCEVYGAIFDREGLIDYLSKKSKCIITKLCIANEKIRKKNKGHDDDAFNSDNSK